MSGSTRFHPMPSNAFASSGDMESMPSGETGIPRPDMSRTYEQLAGASSGQNLWCH